MERAGMAVDLGRRIRKIRQEKGLTLRAVQQRARVSATHISEIERGKTSPTVGVLDRIATALGVGPGELLDTPPRPHAALRTVRDRRRAVLNGGSVEMEGLTEHHGPSELGVHLVSLESDSALPAEAGHEGEEFCYVLEGALEVRIDGVPFLVRPREGLHFRPRTHHELRNPTGAPVRFLWACRPRAAL
ncbi:MAG: XRE family transcriptional regulator [Candidatus Eisenbacteria bacterium]